MAAAQNTLPRFASTPRIGMGQASTANTNRDGTGTIVTLLTGVAAGTLIEGVRIVATGTTTAGVIRLFLNDGSNTRLIAEILVTAITPSTSVKVFEDTWVPELPLILPSADWSIRASTHNAETFNLFAQGADLTE